MAGIKGEKSGTMSKAPPRGIVKAAPNKLKKVMKKGALPPFSFDDRSIFVSCLPRAMGDARGAAVLACICCFSVCVCVCVHVHVHVEKDGC